MTKPKPKHWQEFHDDHTRSTAVGFGIVALALGLWSLVDALGSRRRRPAFNPPSSPRESSRNRR